jgi:hypothetical protein
MKKPSTFSISKKRDDVVRQIDALLRTFGFLDKPEIVESFHELKAKGDFRSITIPTVSELVEALGQFADRDRITIDIRIDDLDPVTYNPTREINEFLSELFDIVSVKDEESVIAWHLTVRKEIDQNQISVYDLDFFSAHLESLSLTMLLFSFNQIVSGHGQILFELINDEYTFYTRAFSFAPRDVIFGSNFFPIDRNATLEKHADICNYLNASEYRLVPDDFYVTDFTPDRIKDIFGKLCTFLSIIFIADISKIVGENELFFRINGYKMIQDTVRFGHFIKPNTQELYNIYTWIYNEGNLSDKAGLSRNIMTLNYQADTIIKETTYASIRSGYEIYLKKNIEQYIEVKNKVSEFLMNMSYKSSEIVDSFSNSIKNSNFIFLSFFLSVIVFNTLSTGKIKLIFTPEIEILSYSILLISLLFLLVSVFYSYETTKRFKKQYKNLKSMYTDIIEEKDLHNIFNQDKGHEDDLEYILNKTSLYAVYWFLEIVILLVAVVLASNH